MLMRSMARLAQMTSAKELRSSVAVPALAAGRLPGAGSVALRSGPVGRDAEAVLARHWKKMLVAAGGIVTCTLARAVAMDSPPLSSNASKSTSLFSAMILAVGGSLAARGNAPNSDKAAKRKAVARAND